MLIRFLIVSKNNKVVTWPKWKIKVVFQHLRPIECLLHPSAVLNKSGYFKEWVCLFIEEQPPECERTVLSKQRHWPQLCLKWDTGPEEPFHTSEQRSVDKRVWVRGCPPPRPPTLRTRPQCWLFHSSKTHKCILKPSKTSQGFPDVLLHSNYETLTVVITIVASFTFKTPDSSINKRKKVYFYFYSSTSNYNSRKSIT